MKVAIRMPSRRRKDAREIETEAFTKIELALAAAEDFLTWDVEESRESRKLMRDLGKARAVLDNMRDRFVAREYPAAAAQRSYRCPKCREHVSPICSSCGNDPRVESDNQ